jgi:hypothetical protein
VRFFDGGSNGIQSIQASTEDYSHVLILMRSVTDSPESLHFQCDHGGAYDAIERAELSKQRLSLTLRPNVLRAILVQGYDIACAFAESERAEISRGLRSLFRHSLIFHDS